MNQPTALEVFGDPQTAQLADAAAAGDVTSMRRLIKEGADINAQGDRGVSIAIWAIFHRSTRGLAYLVDLKADVSLTDEHGMTVMHYAAGADDPDLLAALLMGKPDLNVRNAVSGETPLATALMHDRQAQFEMLLQAGADPNLADAEGNLPLHQAAKVNDLPSTLALLVKGSDPTAINGQGVTFQRYLNTTPDNFRTAEAKRIKAEVDQWLLGQGIELETAE